VGPKSLLRVELELLVNLPGLALIAPALDDGIPIGEQTIVLRGMIPHPEPGQRKTHDESGQRDEDQCEPPAVIDDDPRHDWDHDRSPQTSPDSHQRDRPPPLLHEPLRHRRVHGVVQAQIEAEAHHETPDEDELPDISNEKNHEEPETPNNGADYGDLPRPILVDEHPAEGPLKPTLDTPHAKSSRELRPGPTKLRRERSERALVP
jgi:hypothetical protein